MQSLKSSITVLFIAVMLNLSHEAHACADGPDHYSVRNVALDDVLNVRSGPGIAFSVIGHLPPTANGIKNLDHVPLNACDSIANLTDYERKNMWTKVSWTSPDGLVVGWVKSRYLGE